MNLEAWVCSWDRDANQRLANILYEECKVPKVTCLVMKDHEAKVWNHALAHSEAPFTLICDSDIVILYPDYVKLMYDFISTHDDVGLISPNREGEPRNLGAQVVDWWNDSPSPIFRKGIVRFDYKSYLFTQYQDIDISLEYKHLGYRVVRDRRISINHGFADWSGKSSFYGGYAARNKLVFDTKWALVGKDKWEGVEAYNKTVPEERRIPTLFDLAGMSEQGLVDFAASVETELFWFFEGGRPNERWVNPVYV